MAGTRRERIAELLREGGSWTSLELARKIGAPVKTVLDDLEHVRRGLREGEVWTARAAECEACGFEFRDRTRLDRPSRCPECKSEMIREAAFGIISRGGTRP